MATAVRGGLIPSSPCTGLWYPRIERKEMRFLQPFENSDLAAAMDPRSHAIVLLGAYGGLRIGEMFALGAGQVDVLHGRVDVVENCVEVGGYQHFGPPKTRARRRSVPIPQVVSDALGKHLRSWNATPEDSVFQDRVGGPVHL